MGAERYKWDPTWGELEKLRAEVRDLKARLAEVRRQCHGREEQYAAHLLSVADLRRKKWRGK